MRLGALILLGGCAQLFGIDQTTGSGGGGGSNDAPPAMASLRFVRMSIGASVVRAPQDLAGQNAVGGVGPDP